MAMILREDSKIGKVTAAIKIVLWFAWLGVPQLSVAIDRP